MYYYQTQKQNLFTDEGQRAFLKVRDRTAKLLRQAGAARMQEMVRECQICSSWDQLACVDRMVELGEIREVQMVNPPMGQYRVFVNRTLLEEGGA